MVQKNTIDALGVTTNTWINKNTAYYASLGGNLSKQYKRTKNWQVSLSEGASLFNDHRTFFLNGQETQQSTYNVNFSQGVNLFYKQVMQLFSTYTFTPSITRYSNPTFNDINILRHSAGSNLRLMWPAHTNIEVNYSYNYNTQIAPGFPRSTNILNASIAALMLKKDRGQIKLSVYDLLNENISITRTATGNSVNTQDLQILRRYFMLTLQYRILTTTTARQAPAPILRR